MSHEVAVKDSPVVPSQLHQDILACKRNVQQEFVRLGLLLKTLRDGRHYLAIGYRTFKLYVESSLDFHERKAEYLIALIEHPILGPRLQEDSVRRIGWGKLALISEAPRDQVEPLLEVAEKTPYRQLVGVVRQRQAHQALDEGKPAYLHVPFQDKPDYEYVRQIMESVMRYAGVDSPAAALVFMAQEVHSSHPEWAGPPLEEEPTCEERSPANTNMRLEERSAAE